MDKLRIVKSSNICTFKENNFSWLPVSKFDYCSYEINYSEAYMNLNSGDYYFFEEFMEDIRGGSVAIRFRTARLDMVGKLLTFQKLNAYGIFSASFFKNNFAMLLPNRYVEEAIEEIKVRMNVKPKFYLMDSGEN